MNADQPAKTYIYQLYTETGYHLKNLPIGMDGKRESRKSLPIKQLNDDEITIYKPLLSYDCRKMHLSTYKHGK